MPFDKKRDKQLRLILPAARHLWKREICVRRADASNGSNKSDDNVEEISSDSFNYSLDSDSWEYSSDDY